MRRIRFAALVSAAALLLTLSACGAPVERLPDAPEAAGNEAVQPAEPPEQTETVAENPPDTGEGQDAPQVPETPTDSVPQKDLAPEKQHPTGTPAEADGPEKSETPETPPEPDDSTPAELRGARPSTAGALSVEGTYLVDAAGERVQLRGVSTHGLAWFPQYVNAELFRELSEDWGCNAVRLAMYTAEYGGWCTGGDRSALKKLVTDGVRYAADADMYVIVDWHILSDGDPNTYKSGAADFFRDITAELSGFNNVLYEICNEPNGGTGWDRVKSYAEEIIPVIRENAPDAVILVGTPNWSQRVDEAARDPITGFENIMYTLHFYSGTHKKDLRDTVTAALDAGLPIFVSEFGVTDASGSGGVDTAEADRWVETLNGRGVSYMMWSLSNKDESSAVIKSSCSKTSGFSEADLKESGLWLLDTLSGDAAVSVEEAREPEKTDGEAPQGATQPPEAFPPTEETGGEGQLTWTLTEVNSWESSGERFTQYTLTVTNAGPGDMDTWRVDLDLGSPFTLESSWNGVFSVSGSTLTVTPADYNAALQAGSAAADIGFILSQKG